MGGLRRQMPWTFGTFLVGTLAIAGIPPLAGFFSKDEILSAALGGGAHGALRRSASSRRCLTAFYMARLRVPDLLRRVPRRAERGRAPRARVAAGRCWCRSCSSPIGSAGGRLRGRSRAVVAAGPAAVARARPPHARRPGSPVVATARPASSAMPGRLATSTCSMPDLRAGARAGPCARLLARLRREVLRRRGLRRVRAPRGRRRQRRAALAARRRGADRRRGQRRGPRHRGAGRGAARRSQTGFVRAATRCSILAGAVVLVAYLVWSMSRR